MDQIAKSRIIFIFNPRGYEGFYVQGDSEADRAQGMQIVSEVQDDMTAIGKRIAQNMGEAAESELKGVKSGHDPSTGICRTT